MSEKMADGVPTLPKDFVSHLVKIDQGVGHLIGRFEEAVGERDDREKVARLLTDAQQTLTEAVGVLHSQMSDVILHLQTLATRTVPQQQAPPHGTKAAWARLAPWQLGVIFVIVVGCGGSILWHVWPDKRWSPLALKVDAALVEYWPRLDKPLQDRLIRIYESETVRSPAQRQKGK